MTETPDAGAIEARRAQIRSEARPTRLGDLDLRTAVEHVRDTDDLVKVYVRAWVIVYTSQASGQEGRAEAKAHYEAKFKDRVFPEHVRYEPSSALFPEEFGTRVLLYLPTVVGEFKTRDLAEAFVAREQIEGATLVSRNSRDEYALREYGTKKLSSDQIARGVL